MLAVKRAPGIHFTLERRETFDLSHLLKGKLGLGEQEQIIACAGTLSKEIVLDLADVQVLVSADSAHWEDAVDLAQRCGVELKFIEQLVESGLLLSSDTCPPGNELESLSAWDQSALYYHKRSQWAGRGVDSDLPATALAAKAWVAESPAFFSRLTEKFGNAPTHFHERIDRDQRIDLALGTYRSPLTETLQARRTTRIYDTEKPLEFDIFSSVLFHVFGCQGYANLSGEMIAIKKTSPSGGALHPVEVYPLIIAVDGLAPGIYHYHVGDHALEPMRHCSEQQARELAKAYTAGQAYFASAHVLLLYTARYERNFWKYRHHRKVYKVIQMDAGHLSQTLYLMCAELGLGAFFTAACNDADIERELGLDGITEGAVAVGGFGIPSAEGDVLSFPTRPYIPRSTKL